MRRRTLLKTARAERAGIAVLGVLVMHAMLAWWWFGAGSRQRPPASPPRVSIRLIPLPAERPRPFRDAAPARPLAVAPRVDTPHREAAATPAWPGAITASAEAASTPAASASQPATEPSLLDNDATRRAIRASARATGIAGLANGANGTPRPPSEAERLGAAIGTAAHGDCMKGEYAGGGMGLLSLPFLAAAAATGQCAR